MKRVTQQDKTLVVVQWKNRGRFYTKEFGTERTAMAFIDNLEWNTNAHITRVYHKDMGDVTVLAAAGSCGLDF